MAGPIDKVDTESKVHKVSSLLYWTVALDHNRRSKDSESPDKKMAAERGSHEDPTSTKSIKQLFAKPLHENQFEAISRPCGKFCG